MQGASYLGNNTGPSLVPVNGTAARAPPCCHCRLQLLLLVAEEGQGFSPPSSASLPVGRVYQQIESCPFQYDRLMPTDRLG